MKRLFVCLAASFLVGAKSLPAQWSQTNGPFVGRIKCLAIHGASLFAGTTGGGLFRSTDNGTTWSGIGLGVSNVNSLAVNGANLFAGTDSGVSVLTDNGTGWKPVKVVAAGGPVLHLAVQESLLFVVTNRTGMLRYAGDGANWTKIDSSLAGEVVNTLTFQGRNMFAGTRNGVFLSTDNGAGWTGRNNGLKATEVREIFSHGSKLFAAMGDSLFFSTDSGVSWKPANRGVLATGFFAFAASGTNLFAGGTAGVYRSTDGGMNWSRLESGYANPWIVAMAAGESHVYAGTDGTTFLRSADGGMTWTEITIGLVHALTYSLDAGPTGALFASTEGDLFKTSDGGASWTKADSGMTNVVVNKVALHPDGNTLFAGSSLRSGPQASGIFRSKDNGRSWAPAMAGFLDFHRDVYGFTFNSQGHVFAATNGSVYKSTDKGDSWVRAGNGIQTGLIYAIGTDKDGRLFAGTGAGMFRSEDDGASWTAINDGLPPATRVECLAVNPRGHVFAGDYDGGVHRSTDHGKTWTQVLGQGISMQAWDMVLDSAGNIYVVSVGGETGIWISTDNGDTWANAIPEYSWEFYVQGLEIVGAYLYASTASGVWKRPLSELTASVRPETRPSPFGFELEQNFPNPFRLSTTIRYRLPRHDRIELTIHDLSGRTVRALVRARKPAGMNTTVWDGKDEAGELAKPGIYLFRLRTSAATLSRVMSFMQ